MKLIKRKGQNIMKLIKRKVKNIMKLIKNKVKNFNFSPLSALYYH